MLTLIEIGQSLLVVGDELGRRIDQIVGKTGGRIDLGIPVEINPTSVMMRDDMDHQIGRR